MNKLSQEDPLSVPDSGSVSRMRTIRRQIHTVPELAFQEKKTSDLIASQLDTLGIKYTRNIAETGIMAVISPSQDESNTTACVALRADMDALPLTENTGVSYASQTPGVMHACGHDGHVAMLLGAAELISNQHRIPGKILLLFQPAEESGNGANRMVKEGVLEGVNAIFAGHIDTHYPVGKFTVDEGLICSYTDPFTIHIKGRGGHAARPQEAIDSIVVAANLIMNIQTLVSRKISPTQSAVVTVGKIEGGNVHNAIAEEAILEGTIRSTHSDTRKLIQQGLHKLIQGAAVMSGAEISLNFSDHLPAVINDPVAANLARQTAQSLLSDSGVISQMQPSLGGEDFAFYLKQIPGCLVRFGAATGDPNVGCAHCSRFNFNEDVLPLGAAWLANVALKSLQWQNTGER